MRGAGGKTVCKELNRASSRVSRATHRIIKELSIKTNTWATKSNYCWSFIASFVKCLFFVRLQHPSTLAQRDIQINKPNTSPMLIGTQIWGKELTSSQSPLSTASSAAPSKYLDSSVLPVSRSLHYSMTHIHSLSAHSYHLSPPLHLPNTHFRELKRDMQLLVLIWRCCWHIWRWYRQHCCSVYAPALQVQLEGKWDGWRMGLEENRSISLSRNDGVRDREGRLAM